MLTEFCKIHHPILYQEAIVHTMHCADLSYLLAGARGLDPNLACTAAWIHDASKFLENCGSKSHAVYSSQYAKRLLEPMKDLSDDEKVIIITAIARHSDKQKEDSAYDEILKDADCASRILFGEGELEDLTDDPFRKIRVERVLKELDFTLPVQKCGSEC